jgi:mRNA interferase MazF
MPPPPGERAPLRGRIYLADIGFGLKPWVVVSNNQRNRRLTSVLAARITTTIGPHAPTIVELGGQDPLMGRVLCDDLVQLYAEELGSDSGALSRPTMERVSQGLRAALAL